MPMYACSVAPMAKYVGTELVNDEFHKNNKQPFINASSSFDHYYSLDFPVQSLSQKF